jgi:protein SCO1/2
MKVVRSLIIKSIKMIYKKVLVQFALFALLSCCSFFGLAETNPAPANTDPTSFYSNFENQTFIDQNNRLLPIASLKGKVTLFNFIFTQCSNVCPIQTKQLAEIKKTLSPKLDKNIQFVSVSLDPLNDRPKALKAFAERTGANLPAWSFITGNPKSIQQLVERLQLFGNDKQEKDAKRPNDHTTILWLIDKNGRLVQRYSGNPLDVKRIAQEVAQLYEMPLKTATNR